VIAEAAKKNVVDPDAALALLPRATLEFGDDGEPTNIAEAMDELLQAKPFLVAPAGGARGNADQGARGGAGKSQLRREDLQTMSPADIVKAQKEGKLDRVLAGDA
jgi:hypothetical protein